MKIVAVDRYGVTLVDNAKRLTWQVLRWDWRCEVCGSQPIERYVADHYEVHCPQCGQIAEIYHVREEREALIAKMNIMNALPQEVRDRLRENRSGPQVTINDLF